MEHLNGETPEFNKLVDAQERLAKLSSRGFLKRTGVNPDKWVILKLSPSGEDGGYHYRILGGWFGGYLDGDSWRLNSGVESYEFSEDNSTVFFKGWSGSIYECRKGAEGMTGLMLQVFDQWVDHYGAEVVQRVSLEEFLRDFSNE